MVQVCCKKLPVYLSTVLEENNVHRFRNTDKCRETQLRLRVSLSCHPAAANLAFFFSHPLWPFILAVSVACAGFFPGLESVLA